MAAVPSTRPRRRPMDEEIPPLENGDRLTQPEFHRRYEAMPEGVKAELIGGVVHMPSPLKPRHGRPHALLMTWLGTYQSETPGTDALDNTTVIMGDESEPQPDGALVLEANGGTFIDEDGFLSGVPELLGEIAHTSESIDLHAKRDDYEKAGVKEYIVVAVRMKKVFWWIRRGKKFVDLAAGKDGILRSETFPGLWLDPDALLRRDLRRVLAVLRKGIASPEHAAFVQKLAGRK